MKRPLSGYALAGFLAVVGTLALLAGAPGLLVIASQVLLLALFYGFGVLRIRQRSRKPAQAVSGPNPGQLANQAATARRHAHEYGLPTDPWTQLEGFWTAAGDLPLVIDDLEPSLASDKFMDELAAAMTSPLHNAQPHVVTEEELDAEIARLERELPPPQEPFDFDAFVRRTRNRLQRSTTRTEREAIKADVDRHIRRSTQASSDSPVQIVNGAGQVLRTYDPNPTVRCTWTLSGTPEDDHVIRALKDAGVTVAVEATDVKVAHLAGKQDAINQAKRVYTHGWRQRRTTTGVGPPPTSITAL